mmetsp:Transcript_3537/g.13528  ORF Transcript_3537/g.13528 Transcript_3537/m.13528 type:complete len:693 (-) Transcript_3537:210-2288(-)|eukprot:CAMPEP_0117446072 /NCGR_PEP_ID=MMETSP0759-20121206/6137_1 /TAXON_ID=63605 /ORGANISM="Percolomonas cosmopolitus, Strain WS" /LENGTH=692 /DNA_ID=CAMNT_0005238297 /DNA_START=743 /DNA_END=2821 /DNA_ORIENTATION=+
MSFNDFYSQQANVQQQPLEFFENILLAVRVIDGLFIGNAISSQDDEFLFSNKVTHIVNCAALDVPNVFSDHGIHYLSFPWRDGSVILDSQNRKIARITKFMERAFDKGECVLVHSLHGISRCCVIVCAYLMYRFEWSLDDALTFVKINHPDMDIAPHFMMQLKNYAKNIVREGKTPQSEQILLKNTFANSLPFDHSQLAGMPHKASINKRVNFSSKLVAKRRTPNHNPNALRSILRVKHSQQHLREQTQVSKKVVKGEPETPPRRKRVAFMANEKEVSSRSLKQPAPSKNSAATSSNIAPASQQEQPQQQQTSTSSRLQSNLVQVDRTSSQAVPPPAPKSPNHHRLKRADSEDQSTLNLDSVHEKRNGFSGSSQSRDSQPSSKRLAASQELRPSDKPVLRNNFTESHTKVTQLANSPKVSFSMDQSQHASSNSSLSTQNDNSSAPVRRSHAFEIVSQSTTDPDKRKRKKRSNSLDRRPLSSSFSSLSIGDMQQSMDEPFARTAQNSSSNSHRKRPTMVRKPLETQNNVSTALFTQRSNTSSNRPSSHRIFQSRDPLSSSQETVFSNGHSSNHVSHDSLSGILTSSQLGTTGQKKITTRRPRSATHRKRRPTPMHQRPQSAPNPKDRSNGTMSRISSLENIYGTNKKKKKSSSSSSDSTKRKKRSTKRSTANYANVESRLYNPTLSFLRKTIQ